MTPVATTPPPLPVNKPLAAPIPVAPALTGYEPLQPEEVAAFKQALATASSPTPLVAPGEIVHSGRRNPLPPVNFEDTEIDDRPSPLSGTQYGDL